MWDKRKATILIIKCGFAIGLMVWVIFSALKMETRKELGEEWTTLSKAEKFEQIIEIGPKKVLVTFTSIEPLAFILSLGCVGVTIIAGVVRLKQFMESVGCDTDILQLISITMVGYFFNSFLLGSTGGDVAKAYYFAKIHPNNKEAAVSAVFMDRIFGMCFMMIFAILAIFPLFRVVEVSNELNLYRGAFTKFLVTSLGVVLLVLVVIWQFSKTKLKIPKGIIVKVQKIKCAIRNSISHPKLFIRASLWSLIINYFCILQIAALCWGLDIKVSFLFLIFAVPVIITISAIPLTPSGFGIRENLYVLLFGLAASGVDASQALALSLLAYAGTFFWNLVGGVFFLLLKPTGTPGCHQ